jgi:hypothetical protein
MPVATSRHSSNGHVSVNTSVAAGSCSKYFPPKFKLFSILIQNSNIEFIHQVQNIYNHSFIKQVQSVQQAIKHTHTHMHTARLQGEWVRQRTCTVASWGERARQPIGASAHTAWLRGEQAGVGTHGEAAHGDRARGTVASRGKRTR